MSRSHYLSTSVLAVLTVLSSSCKQEKVEAKEEGWNPQAKSYLDDRSTMEFWNVVEAAITAKNQTMPESFSGGDRAGFHRAQSVLDSLEEDPIVQEADRLEDASNAFISCWNSSFPRSVVDWVKTRSKHFSQILCVNSETGEQGSGGNGGQRL